MTTGAANHVVPVKKYMGFMKEGYGMKKIPYGMSNFEELREKGYMYVDKTRYIEILENDAPYQFFIRPRRFGKSLFVSMLEKYYDINKKDMFETLFEDTYIGKNPTPERNSYLVLSISFAGIITSEGKEIFVQSFNNNIAAATRNFFVRYGSIFKDVTLPEYTERAETAIRQVIYETHQANRKLFLFIDEYDNFANDLIGTGNKEFYYDLLSSEGYVRVFYKTLKDGTTKSISRVFMTGVSPIMLDDLTSGFNITKNLTMYPTLNEMLGFTREELEKIIKALKLDEYFVMEELLRDMETYYNGYLFNEDGKGRIYNTNMVLYFLDSLNHFGKYPKNILDANVKTDYKKIEALAFNFKDEGLIQRLLAEGEITVNIVERFNLEYMYENKENFASVLFYTGMLTIKEAAPKGYILQIPNYVIKTIYWEYYLDKLERTQNVDFNFKRLLQAVDEMAVEGKAHSLESYLCGLFEALSNRDLIRFDEKYIKVMLMTLFYHNGYYIVNSEYETDGGYVDIFLSRNRAYAGYIKYDWLIEVKYLKEEERENQERAERKGLEQLERYFGGRLQGAYAAGYLKKLLIIVIGRKDVKALLCE